MDPHRIRDVAIIGAYAVAAFLAVLLITDVTGTAILAAKATEPAVEAWEWAQGASATVALAAYLAPERTWTPVARRIEAIAALTLAGCWAVYLLSLATQPNRPWLTITAWAVGVIFYGARSLTAWATAGRVEHTQKLEAVVSRKMGRDR